MGAILLVCPSQTRPPIRISAILFFAVSLDLTIQLRGDYVVSARVRNRLLYFLFLLLLHLVALPFNRYYISIWHRHEKKNKYIREQINK